ncbi:hypothetical protein PCASD_12573 [Puccinia coronata f. sp. avenae]|uniref:Uncharacterized protein n=1 Tax=Puccinia coronata f. sp. avenae TaxID=200324 RepID=A0A2N5UMC9_9BASI|nr:hypothetical protein PCASD_12573 [Puccinia coronata f. sp. avenae]
MAACQLAPDGRNLYEYSWTTRKSFVLALIPWSLQVLNKLIFDRGPSPYMSLLRLFGNDHQMTAVQADGLAVPIPTGSTAYSLSGGGCLVYPKIPALPIAPILPHTIS